MTQPRLITDGEWARMSWNARQQWLRSATAARRRLLTPLMDEITRLRAEIDALEKDKTAIQTRYTGPKIVHPNPEDWTAAELRGAHAAHSRGDRDQWALTGHRIWDAARKRRATRIKEMSR